MKNRIHIFRSEIFSVFRFGIPANKLLFAVLLRRRSVTSRLSFRVRLVAMPGAVCRFFVLYGKASRQWKSRLPPAVPRVFPSGAGPCAEDGSVFEANKSGLFHHFSLQSGRFDIILYRLQLFLPARRKGGVALGVSAVTDAPGRKNALADSVRAAEQTFERTRT